MKEEFDKKALVALQRGLPLQTAPFRVMADELGCPEDELLERIVTWQENGVIRRVGGVFHSRRMGFRSVLCACSNKSGKELAELAEKLQSTSGVTHCYEREPLTTKQEGMFGAPRLWFTFLAEDREFENKLATLCVRLGEQPVHILPAVRRFKTQVILGDSRNVPAHGKEMESSTLPPLTERQRNIVALLQGNVCVAPRLWVTLAKDLGIQSADLLSDLHEMRAQGRLKRVAAVLHHQQAGWRANAMALWRVQETDIERRGQALAAQPEVTHCYARPPFPGFPYTLYAMLHAPDWERLDRLAVRVAKTALLPPPFLLASRREFIKRSPRYVVTPQLRGHTAVEGNR
ncbi:MAG: hypothetical protein KAI66_15065, partial [Lentisphaeria bacterium]|nr:hypothetical protein [Lentisphaeria bacterium]